MRVSFLFNQGAQVFGLLDAQVSIEASHVIGQHLGGLLRVHHAHAFLGRNHTQASLHVGVWHAVVVSIKAHVRRLAHADFDLFFDGEFVARQLQHACAILLVGLENGLVFGIGHPALRGDFQAPCACLLIEIVDRRKRSSRKEVLTQVSNRALYTPLFVGPIRRTRAWLEAIVARKSEQRRVKANRIAFSLDHRAL